MQIVSDMAARGLDVADCDAVFNLELPSSAAAYAHRAGRTARAGRCVSAQLLPAQLQWLAVAAVQTSHDAPSRIHFTSCMWCWRREGTVVSIVTPGEAFVVDKLARRLRIEVPEADVSGGSIAIRD